MWKCGLYWRFLNDVNDVFYTGTSFCDFPVAGAAADKTQQQWGFHMADFPMIPIPQRWPSPSSRPRGLLQFKKLINFCNYTVAGFLNSQLSFLKVSGFFPCKDMQFLLISLQWKGAGAFLKWKLGIQRTCYAYRYNTKSL